MTPAWADSATTAQLRGADVQERAGAIFRVPQASCSRVRHTGGSPRNTALSLHYASLWYLLLVNCSKWLGLMHILTHYCGCSQTFDSFFSEEELTGSASARSSGKTDRLLLGTFPSAKTILKSPFHPHSLNTFEETVLILFKITFTPLLLIPDTLFCKFRKSWFQWIRHFLFPLKKKIKSLIVPF